MPEHKSGTKIHLEDELATNVRHSPLWYVILHDDESHTYGYVIQMLITLFKMTSIKALAHASEVDAEGYTIIARLPKQKAADKRDQIMRFGGDPALGTSNSMKASIEPCDD